MKLRILITAVLVLCFSGTIFAQQKQNRRNQNRSRRQISLPDNIKVNSDIEYAQVDGESLLLDIYLPKKNPGRKMPVVVWVHGGGWRNGSKAGGGRRLRVLLENGYIGVSINYRLTGINSWPAQINDCKAAIRWIRANADWYNFDPDRIGVWGSSAGGHLVAMLGTSGDVKNLEGKLGNPDYSSRVQAVCDYFGPSDLLSMRKQSGKGGRIDHDSAGSPESRLVGGPLQKRQEIARSASPVNYVSSDDPPFFILHGTEDPVVPCEQSKLLHKRLKEKGVDSTLKLIEGAGHGFRNAKGLEQLVLKFFDKHLKTEEARTNATPKSSSSAK